MTRIGIISDTHSWLDEAVFAHFEQCDEIWHAGDFGTLELAMQLQNFRPLKGVWGNIDDASIRQVFPETRRWRCEDVEVLMTHIGGYPGKYAPAIRQELQTHPPQLFLCGHSHILKIMYDDTLQCLHINPGAAGRQGWHKVRTLVRLTIDGKVMKDCEVIELGTRG
jgi:uncharacterized protein